MIKIFLLPAGGKERPKMFLLKHSLGREKKWVKFQILVLPLSGCMLLVKLLYLSKPPVLIRVIPVPSSRAAKEIRRENIWKA